MGNKKTPVGGDNRGKEEGGRRVQKLLLDPSVSQLVAQTTPIFGGFFASLNVTFGPEINGLWYFFIRDHRTTKPMTYGPINSVAFVIL